ncbi:uncharacterized protein F5147DRAFT_707098 [Suillus discolor]|uniref:Secreted protein n=1 Tax=Suillus discolor TaxID=1912936 RepID=A0A9P7F3E6_9AGAM|nr:uncharacterized protein F5147DRAFT_707098 [Suillus discolor]KAG2102877.1 hypothetical protein F5147DRAFT_707098 [Suillus discolor]
MRKTAHISTLWMRSWAMVCWTFKPAICAGDDNTTVYIATVRDGLGAAKLSSKRHVSKLHFHGGFNSIVGSKQLLVERCKSG